MINSVEDLRSAGVLPTGPVSAWPKERNVAGAAMKSIHKPVPKIKRSPKELMTGLAKTALQGVRNGRVSGEVREERFDTCKTCPAFREHDKRCAECGCFMEAKTWIAGDPDALCPLHKWDR